MAAERVAQVQDLKLGQAANQYLQSLSEPERAVAAPEIHRFVRWFGPGRLLSSFTPPDLERYQEYLSQSGLDTASRLEPVKNFLAEAKKRRWTEKNLGAHLRIRRARSASNSASNEKAAPTLAVTRAGFERMQLELDQLERIERPAAAEEVQRARADGDLRENAPYHAAKQHLAHVQTRIEQLKAQLAAAVIVDDADTERVGVGTTVTLRDLQDGSEVTYTLVGQGEVDSRRHRISVASPLGRALTDHRVGDLVEVQSPGGVHRYEVVRIERAE